jgi:hypothetical protein
MKVPWRVLPNVDFDYDSTWDAAMLAVQQHFPDLEFCNKDDMRIVSFFKQELDVDSTSPYEYAKRAFLNIRAKESAERRTVYDIEVHVGKYWRPRIPIKEPDEDWELIRWTPEFEDEILQSFKAATREDQRIRQDHKKFDKRRSRGWP